jgi:Lectin C-type domain
VTFVTTSRDGGAAGGAAAAEILGAASTFLAAGGRGAAGCFFRLLVTRRIVLLRGEMKALAHVTVGGIWLAGCAFSASTSESPDAADIDARIDARVDAPPQACAGYVTVPGAPATSRYRLLDRARAVADLTAQCAADGAHLVVIDDMAEFNAVGAVAIRLGGFFWVGVGDAAVEGKWMTAKGAPATFLPWDRTQPNGLLTENCVLQGPSAFFDFRCSSSYPSVCECD